MPFLKKKFNQSEIFSDAGGVCYCLCAHWAHEILRAPKDWGGGPTDSIESRWSQMLTPKIILKIKTYQQLFGIRQRKSDEATNRVSAINQQFSEKGLMPILEKNIDLGASELIFQGLISTADKIFQNAIENRQFTMGKFGVNCYRLITKIPLDSIIQHIPQKVLAIVGFETGNSGHAIAIYRTGGYLYNDFYLFDPNYGEFIVSGQKDFNRLVMELSKQYNSATAASVELVSLKAS